MKKFTLLAILFLTACKFGGNEVRPLYPPFLPAPPTGGPQEFQQGWRDGCDTGLAEHGSDVYRTSFKFSQNPALALNTAYYKAFKDGENYCRTYIFEYATRNMNVFCTLDGLQNDCDPNENSKSTVPGLGASTDTIGYSFIGGQVNSGESLLGSQNGNGGITPVMGGGLSDDKFLGGGIATGDWLGDW